MLLRYPFPQASLWLGSMDADYDIKIKIYKINNVWFKNNLRELLNDVEIFLQYLCHQRS